MAEEKAEAAPKGKGNLIFIVIIAVLATLLIGGGITAFLLIKKSGSHAEQTADKGEEAKGEEGGHGEESGGGHGDGHGDKEGGKAAPIYVQMEPPFVVNFDPSQTVRFLQITVEIMTRDPATQTMLKDNNPVLRNDLLMLFGGQDASKLGNREGKEELREKALEAVREIVKKEGGKPAKVEAVYFTTFVMQ